MAITTDDQLIAAVAKGPVVPFLKQSATGKAAGAFHAYWLNSGHPAPGVAQGSVNGAVPTRITAGALPFNNPVSPALTYLSKLFASASAQITVILYDRLWHNSGLSGALATPQTFTMPALTRNTTGEYVEAWIEWYAATGATAANLTMTYTSQAGTANRTAAVAFQQTPVVGQVQPVWLQTPGDYGVRSIQQVQLSASTTVAGNFGMTLRRRLGTIVVPASGLGAGMDYFDLGGMQIPDDACLEFVALLNSTNVPLINGEIGIAQG